MKVTLLGDSIRLIGYGAEVERLLKGRFEVYQPDENCRFSKYTLRGLYDWKAGMEGSNIIHWNNGLWDVSDLYGDGLLTSEQEYIENMIRIADILQCRYSKVVFATTTPVSDKCEFVNNGDIERYNGLLVPMLKERGIVINDLYSTLSSDIDNYISKEDNIHLSNAGIKVCAEQVAEIIRKVSEM